MPSYKFSEIALLCGGQLVGSGNHDIKHLVTDSRTMLSPVNAVFIALRGARHDGHHFIPDLVTKKGFCNFIVNEIPPAFRGSATVHFIVVSNTLHALQLIAAAHRSAFKKPVLGITGSNGKTIVKEWLFQLLHTDMLIVRSPKSYNSQVGVPLSVWNLEQEADFAIFEAGISKHDEMIKLQKIIKPDIGIFTNIGEAHQENFLSYQRKVREKLVLFRDSSHLIFCSDHDVIREEIDDWINKNQQLLTWSKYGTADLQIVNIEKLSRQSKLTALYANTQMAIEIPFTDDASVENCIHCWLLLLHLGYTNDAIALKMLQLTPVAMRLELKKGVRNCTLINDTYNSDIHSLAIALDFLNQQRQHPKRTLILSDILQSGKPETALYVEVARLVAEKKVDKMIGIGNALFANAALFQCEKEFFTGTDEFIKHYQSLDYHNEAILLKGARSFEFERISALLEQKAHRTVLEINLTAMIQNLNYFRSKLNPGTKIMVMVKAFSYGSGSYEIANMLEYQKVDYLAVAFADEGVALRQSGISLPIVVMNPEETAFRLMIDYRLEPEIYSFRELEQFSALLRANNIYQYPVHIKTDTGMHRLGFMEHDIDALCNTLKADDALKIASVFSHMAATDEAIHDEYTHHQATLFNSMCSKISNTLGYAFSKHILNSVGIDRFPQYQFGMVRLGIGLYGINSFNQAQMQCVSVLKSTISQVKVVTSGNTVGYSRKGTTTHDTKIAIIPIGYADGYSRTLSNGAGQVFVKNSMAPVIGNICMDMCMVDITGIDANEGDEVEIFGTHISITDLAHHMGTIPYEVLTGIASRVKRVYVQE